MKAGVPTPGLLLELRGWDAGEAVGIPGEAVKAENIRRTPGGEGGLLD